ncbi:MAG: DUF1349 domain-containing protein [Prevotellaceae bacterium]|jgi:regulation of enolase protein 1 (concanavalin A-like superfamily)|nr:DUF1349 domain-containing protein [Prevotellaceae bacterium]
MKKNIVLFAIFSTVIFSAQAQKKVATIPYPLEVVNQPLSYIVTDSSVEISAKGKTNLFNNPNGKSDVQSAPMLLFAPAGDFTLSAKVTGALKSVYDVAALVVYQNKDTWAKLCYENSVDKIPTIVSVVTRRYSDDCNSVSAGESAYLAMVKKGNEYSLFYAPNKASGWKMIRNFYLEKKDTVKVGFAAHGSRGDGFTAHFSDIKFADKAVEDMRTF